jgi:BNR/Asp-box repeat
MMQVFMIGLLLLCSCAHAPQKETAAPVAKFAAISATEQKEILRSVNAGDTWENMASNLPADAEIGRVTLTSDRIVALAGKSMYERLLSDMVSTNWTETYFPMEKNMSAIDHDAQGLLILAYNKGIFRNMPGTDILTPLHAKYPDLQVRGYTTTPSGIFYSAESGLYRSTDKGATWTKVIQYGFVNKVFQSGNALFATSNDGIQKSTDGGANWTIVAAEGQPSAPIVQFNQHLACISDGKIDDKPEWGQYLNYSHDGGTTWSLLPTLPAFKQMYDFTMNDQYMFCSTRSGVYRSEDKGNTWHIVHAAKPGDQGFLSVLLVGKTVYLIPVVGC